MVFYDDKKASWVVACQCGAMRKTSLFGSNQTIDSLKHRKGCEYARPKPRKKGRK